MRNTLSETYNQHFNWNKFNRGWRVWDDRLMQFLKPQGDEIIAQLKLKDGYQVLDVASGMSESGLAIASRIPNGGVIITDLDRDMLNNAHKHAHQRGIRNIETLAADVSELPFDDGAFDAVSCHLGFMSFPDMRIAANEMVRVLRSGRRFCTTIWAGAEANPWMTIAMRAISKVIHLPSSLAVASGMFGAAQPGLLLGLLRKAGLKDVATHEVRMELPCQSVEDYWAWMTEAVGPVVTALGKTDRVQRAEIKRIVFYTLHTLFPNGELAIEGTAYAIAGTKGDD